MVWPEAKLSDFEVPDSAFVVSVAAPEGSTVTYSKVVTERTLVKVYGLGVIGTGVGVTVDVTQESVRVHKFGHDVGKCEGSVTSVAFAEIRSLTRTGFFITDPSFGVVEPVVLLMRETVEVIVMTFVLRVVTVSLEFVEGLGGRVTVTVQVGVGIPRFLMNCMVLSEQGASSH